MKTLLPDLWTRDFLTNPFRAFERDMLGREFPKMFQTLATQESMAPVPAMNIANRRTPLRRPWKFRASRRRTSRFASRATG